MVGRNVLEHPLANEWKILAPSSRELDLASRDDVCRYFGVHKPDFVIHAAGRVGGIQANISAPVEFLIANLDINRNVIMAAAEAGVPRVLNLGSSCMYPRNATNPLREEMILTGELEPTNEGYALAKIVGARLCDYLRVERGLAYKTMIPCNIYGRHDKFDPERSHLIPAVIHKLHRAKVEGTRSVDIWGDGSARREFMYAGDLADAIHCALVRFDAMPDTMNLGLGHDHTINEYYQTVAEVVGWDGDFDHDLGRPVGMKQKLVSIERQTRWGWQAGTSLRDGIRMTYEYYLSEYVK
jgi:GDP-L-fucose synthase